MTWPAVVALVVGLVGGLAGLASLLLVPVQRRKAKADAAAVIVDSAVDLLKPLQDRAEALARDLAAMENLVRRIKLELARPSPSIRVLRQMVGLRPDGT